MRKVIKGVLLGASVALCAVWCLHGMASPAWLNWCAFALFVAYLVA